MRNKTSLSSVPKEEEHKCVQAQNLSAFFLASETPKEAPVSFDSEDMHIEEEHNYGNISNKRAM